MSVPTATTVEFPAGSKINIVIPSTGLCSSTTYVLEGKIPSLASGTKFSRGNEEFYLAKSSSLVPRYVVLKEFKAQDLTTGLIVTIPVDTQISPVFGSAVIIPADTELRQKPRGNVYAHQHGAGAFCCHGCGCGSAPIPVPPPARKVVLGTKDIRMPGGITVHFDMDAALGDTIFGGSDYEPTFSYGHAIEATVA